jgi:hypothetical protein
LRLENQLSDVVGKPAFSSFHETGTHQLASEREQEHQTQDRPMFATTYHE